MAPARLALMVLLVSSCGIERATRGFLFPDFPDALDRRPLRAAEQTGAHHQWFSDTFVRPAKSSGPSTRLRR
jgi:hypothetical protein